ncbi:MAG: hypothetical protein ACXVA9_03115, partial [Bdellovibrionales bacterium]
SGSNVDGGFARLRDNFPFNGGLLKGSFYRITAILEKKSGAGFNIENNSFALQNEFGKIEVVNRNWLSEFRNQTSTSYYTITTPLGVQELKQLLSSLNKYGVPPPAPFFKDYTPVQLKKSIAVKLSPSFPKSGRSGGIQQPISTVFTKTRSPFNSVGGKPTEFKDGAGKFSEIDSEGPHYVILSPDGEHKVLVDVRWLEPVLAVPRAMNRIKIGGILDLEDISYDSFPAQMDLIKEFITLYPTRDKFAWSNIQAAQISDDWKKCSSDYDCGAGLLNCVGWVPVNKTHTYGLRKSIEGDKNTCGKFAGPGPEPKIQCQKNICVAMAQLEHPESACTKDSDCVVVKYDCNQGTAVNAAHAEEMRAKICKCHDCVSNDCSEFNPHGIVPTCHDHSECAASFTGVGYYPLSGPDTRPDPIGEKWAKRFGGKSYPNCGK